MGSQQPAVLIATCAGSQNINILRLKRSWLSKLRSQFSKTSKMTFCMTQSVKVVVEEDPDAEPPKTLREIEEEKQAEKKAQQKKDYIALLIAMVMILAAATGTVFFKLYVIDEPPNPNISTFRPLPMQLYSVQWKPTMSASAPSSSCP